MTLASRTIAEAIHWDPKTTASTAASTSAADKTFTVGTGKEWRPLSLRAELATSTQSGNRQLELQYRDASNNVIHSVMPEAVQASGSTRYYDFAIGAPQDSTFVDTDKIRAALPELQIPTSYDIRIFDNNAVGTTAAPDNMTVRLHILERDNPTT